MTVPTLLHAAAIAAFLVSVASAALARKIGSSPAVFPTSAIEATVEPGETFVVPVGAPAVYAWLDVGQLVQGRGALPAAQPVWAGGAGAATVRFRAGDRLLEIPGPQITQFKGYSYENRQAETFAELGLGNITAAPGPRGVYANQVALRPGDIVSLVETQPIEIWRGGRAEIEAANAEVAAHDRRISRVLYAFAALCAFLAFGLTVARWSVMRGSPA